MAISSANLATNSAKTPSSIARDIKKFLSDPNDAPPYGYQDNPMTGIGFWMMQGARVAISLYEGGSSAISPWNNVFRRRGRYALYC